MLHRLTGAVAVIALLNTAAFAQGPASNAPNSPNVSPPSLRERDQLLPRQRLPPAPDCSTVGGDCAAVAPARRPRTKAQRRPDR